MSNTDNIYNILNNFNKIAKDAPAPIATPKAKTKLQESMEQVVNEKYMGFKKTVAAIKKSGSAEDPEAVAAAIGRKKYGKEKFQKAAAAGKKLNEKAVNPYAVGMAVAKKKAGITAKSAHDLPKKVVKKAHEIAKKIDEGTAEEMTPNWAKYVLDQLHNSNGDVTMTDLFDEGIPGLRAMFMDTAQELGLDTDEDFMDVEHEVIVKLENFVKGEHELDEGFDDMIKDVNRKAKEKGTGKFDKKEISTGTVYTRKYNPKSGETDDTENVSAEKRGRGRPKKSAFEDMSTIDKMIAESFGELFEEIRIVPLPKPVGDPASKAAPAAPAVGSDIRVSPKPASTNSTPSKSKEGMGSIRGGVWTADPPKAGERGVPVPQGLDEVDTEMEGMRKLAGLKGGQKKLDRDHDGKLTGKDFSMLRKGLEEGGASMPGDQYLSIPADQTKLSLGQRMARDGITYSGDNEREMIGIIAKYMKDQGESLSTIRYYMNDDDFVADALSDLRAASSQKPDYKSKMQAKFGGSAEDLTRGLSIQSKKVEEGGDDYDELQDKIQWLMGAPNYLSRDEAKETAAYTPETDSVWDGYRDDTNELEEDDMEEGNAFSGAVAKAKADGVQPGEKIKVGGKEYDLKEGDAALNQMRRIAGLKECGMSPVGIGAADMHDEQGSMNISTSQNSSGSKSVTITADGDAASSLMQMLKLAGMGGSSEQAAEPQGMVIVAQDSEEDQGQEMEEEKDPRYQASTTPDEQVAPVQALTKGGNGDVAGQEKKMKPGGYQFGDNNLAMQESLSTQLMKEYNSIKIKK